MISAELAFTLVNGLVLPSWIALMAVPDKQQTKKLVRWTVVGLGFVYLLLVRNILTGSGSTDLFTLSGLQQGFQQPWILVLGWVHYLCFDLFVGSWVAHDGLRRGLPRLLVLPCLFFTLMVGPVGLLLYLLVRTRTKVAENALQNSGSHF